VWIDRTQLARNRFFETFVAKKLSNCSIAEPRR
jgi:hypothetical protein